jgi:hypothetical protein
LSLQIERLLGNPQAGHSTVVAARPSGPAPAVTSSMVAEQDPEAIAAGATLTGWMWDTPAADDREAQQRRMIVVCALFAYLGIILTLAQGVLVRRLATRMSEVRMALVGGALAVAGFVSLAVAVDRSWLGLLLLGMAIEVVGFAFINPALQALLSRRSDPTLQGGILGLGQSLSSLARILGPLGGPWMLSYWATLPYVVATVLMGFGLTLTVVAARRGSDFGTSGQ